MNTPKIRFKGFTDDWEQRKLPEFVSFFNGLTYTPDDVQNTGTLVLRSSNVKNGEIVDADNVYVNAKVATSENVQEGDIIVVVRNGSRALIGKHAQIKASMPNTVIGAFMSGMRSQYSSFVNALLDTSAFENEIAKNMGATINQITGYMFSKMGFMIPSGEEQHKIGEYFTTLDNLITLHQRKCDETKQLKKFMLQKMFPKNGEKNPEIRFEGFTDDWEQRKFGDVIEKLTGGASIAPDDYVDVGYRTIPKGAVNSSGVADMSGCKNVSQNFFKKNISSKTSSGELVTSLRDLVPTAPNMGRIVRICGETEDFLMPQGVYSIIVKEKISEDFLITYSNSPEYRKIIMAEKNGSTQVHIRNGEFLNIDIPLPSHEEQGKIGEYFKTLDHLITLHQRKCEKLKELKKFMLQNMFV